MLVFSFYLLTTTDLVANCFIPLLTTTILMEPRLDHGDKTSRFYPFLVRSLLPYLYTNSLIIGQYVYRVVSHCRVQHMKGHDDSRVSTKGVSSLYLFNAIMV